jgi:predicted DNA-binding transcriptional regulator AlpA
MPNNSHAIRPEKRALTVQEFCAAYGPARSSVYKLMAEGKLRTVKVAGRRLIPVDVAESLLKPGEK